MTIRSRLLILATLPLTVILLLSAVSMLARQQMMASFETNNMIDEIAQETFELNLLASDYVLLKQETAQLQWNSKYQSLGETISKLEIRTLEERAAVSKLIDTYEYIGVLFSQLVDATDRESSQYQERESLIATQLLVNAQSMTSDCRMLRDIAAKELLNAQRRASHFFWPGIALVVAATLAISFLIYWSIMKPLKELRRGTDAVGAGNLDYSLSTATKDEIGGLSRSFARMTASLKMTTVSRDKLVKEVAQRKQVEEELRETMEELQRSNAELQQFAYVASHELQEPLRMVSSYTQLLERRYKDKLDADADDFINYAVNGSKRMQQLINDLLVYSRVGTRGKPLEPTDCVTVFDAAVANLDVAIQNSGAVVTRDLLPRVMAEEGQLVQLFQNLIGNAIKFHGLQPPRVHVAAEKNGNDWVFSVRDNGIGIDPQYFERIFTVFQRLHCDEYPGTGIGLAISQKIIQRHGGQIWLESQPGEGSRFYFTIPRKRGKHS